MSPLRTQRIFLPTDVAPLATNTANYIKCVELNNTNLINVHLTRATVPPPAAFRE